MGRARRVVVPGRVCAGGKAEAAGAGNGRADG